LFNRPLIRFKKRRKRKKEDCKIKEQNVRGSGLTELTEMTGLIWFNRDIKIVTTLIKSSSRKKGFEMIAS